MINTKYLLCISTCLLVSSSLQASDINLTYDSSGFLPGSSSLYTLHTPSELRPTSSFNFENAVKLAAVCSVGGGGCNGLSFGSSPNSMNLDNASLCKEAGYSLTSCPSGADPKNRCPHNSSFFDTCVCNTSYYTQSGTYSSQCGSRASVESCTDSKGNKYYRCTCDSSTMTTCSAGNQYSTNSTVACKDTQTNLSYVLNTECKTCTSPAVVNSSENGCTCPSNYAACGTNQTGVGTVCTENGVNKYTSCKCPDNYVACNSSNNEVGNGKSCTLNGVTKYESCKCNDSWVTCGTNQEGVGGACSIGGVAKYASCQCPTSWSTCSDTSPDAGAKSCAINGKTYYSSCKQKDVNCEAPYYKTNENTCALWEGVAAVVKTCSDLVTTTKNANITGNILVWGTLNCGENQITLPTGQNLVGKGFFNGKYSDATDAVTDKFSKIKWDFTSEPGNAITLEHNAMLSDLTLEIKSDVAGKWSSPSYTAPVLLGIEAKENLIFKNLDLYGDMSAADGKSLTMLDATTGKVSLQGKNSLRVKNAMKSNSDGYSYAANSSTYLMKKGTINIGKDASLDITFTDGGTYYGFLDTNLNLTDNANFTLESNTSSSFKLFDAISSLQYTGNKVTLRGTSKMTVKAKDQFTFTGGIPIQMYDDSIINFRGSSLVSGSGSYNGSLKEDSISMNGNSIINVDGSSTSSSSSVLGMQVTLNNNATLRIKSSGIQVYGSGLLTLNDSSKFIINQKNTTVTDSYYNSNYGVFSSTRGPNMNGSSKLYISADRYIFEDARFNLASTTAKIYAKQTNTSYKIFGAGGSNPEVWLYQTVANAPFYIETPGQKGYNNQEDDGLYLMPALGVSASDGASICSHMTSGYSSSKVNRDLACWTHGTVSSTVNDPANPNNNDYFKGKVCNRCSDGYKLTGVTHVSASDSRFTSAKSDFDKEMTALTNAMNF